MLSKIEEYLIAHPIASLGELSQALGIESGALREMLKLLEQKGRVRRLTSKNCGGCTSCASELTEFYQREEWE